MSPSICAIQNHVNQRGPLVVQLQSRAVTRSKLDTVIADGQWRWLRGLYYPRRRLLELGRDSNNLLITRQHRKIALDSLPVAVADPLT